MARQAQSKLKSAAAGSGHNHQPSVFTCPDCQGTLFLVEDNGLVRFRCRVGHMYSPESMLEAQDDNVERLMWSAVRALLEQAEFLRQSATYLKQADHETARGYGAKIRRAEHGAKIIRKLITRGSEDRVGAKKPS